MKNILICLFGSLFLSACENIKVVPESSDAAPSKQVDTSNIPNAIPKNEPKSRYGNSPVYEVFGQHYTVMNSSGGYRERGVASWYGKKFHGNLTSNREPYDMYAMTAAHKSLPLPSFVRVTNLANQRSVVVRVNDRGPFHGDRLIDLSYAAAWKLGYVEQGTANVKIEALTVPAPESLPQPKYYVQLAASATHESALNHQPKLSEQGYSSEIHQEDGFYKLRLGPLDSPIAAERLRRKLREQEHPQAFVIAL